MYTVTALVVHVYCHSPGRYVTKDDTSADAPPPSRYDLCGQNCHISARELLVFLIVSDSESYQGGVNLLS